MPESQKEVWLPQMPLQDGVYAIFGVKLGVVLEAAEGRMKVLLDSYTMVGPSLLFPGQNPEYRYFTTRLSKVIISGGDVLDPEDNTLVGYVVAEALGHVVVCVTQSSGWAALAEEFVPGPSIYDLLVEGAV